MNIKVLIILIIIGFAMVATPLFFLDFNKERDTTQFVISNETICPAVVCEQEESFLETIKDNYSEEMLEEYYFLYSSNPSENCMLNCHDKSLLFWELIIGNNYEECYCGETYDYMVRVY